MTLNAKQAHRRLALFLGLFLAIHFSAHFAAIGGIKAQGLVLELGRSIYRILPVEVALFVALALQIILGIKLLGIIGKRPRKDFWHYAQFTSAIILAIFIVAHSSAALLSRWQFGLDTNFYWAAGSLTVDPLRYGFIPYYFLAVTALFTHILAALHFRGPRPWHVFALLAGPAAGCVDHPCLWRSVLRH